MKILFSIIYFWTARVFAKDTNAIFDKYTIKDLLGFDSNTATEVGLGQISIIISNVTNLALDLVGLLSFIMILYSSITYLISYGDESKAETAKKTLIWSVIGLSVVILSKFILTMFYKLIAG